LTRFAPTVLVLALLGATAAAFAVSERLKLEPSPITKTRVAKVFSPVCNCSQRVARVQFRLRRTDRLTVQVLTDHKSSGRSQPRAPAAAR
jgi:hypothetical protein